MKSLLVLAGFLTCGAAMSQGDKNVLPGEEERNVMKPIKQLLTALQKGDSALLHQAFTRDVTIAILATDKDGKASIRYEASLDGLLKRVGTPHEVVDNEVMWDQKILVEGDLAQAWGNYAFYLGKKFSHCGVNAFHLTKVDGSWKIFHLSFTRQRDGCTIPSAISKQFE